MTNCARQCIPPTTLRDADFQKLELRLLDYWRKLTSAQQSMTLLQILVGDTSPLRPLPRTRRNGDTYYTKVNSDEQG